MIDFLWFALWFFGTVLLFAALAWWLWGRGDAGLERVDTAEKADVVGRPE